MLPICIAPIMDDREEIQVHYIHALMTVLMLFSWTMNLVQASVVSKAMTGGVQFLQTISSLPLLLISSPEGMTDCVWRGIEVGAAEVLEKPLSTHKLQNIWQHVVRKVIHRSLGEVWDNLV